MTVSLVGNVRRKSGPRGTGAQKYPNDGIFRASVVAMPLKLLARTHRRPGCPPGPMGSRAAALGAANEPKTTLSEIGALQVNPRMWIGQNGSQVGPWPPLSRPRLTLLGSTHVSLSFGRLMLGGGGGGGRKSAKIQSPY